MPSIGGLIGGKWVHHLPCSDPNQSSNNRVVNPSREFESQRFVNVAWKERVDGWKMKQEKNVGQMSNDAHIASEGMGAADIDASTDIAMDDALLNDETQQSLSRKVIDVGGKDFRFTWLHEFGDCDVYEERQSGEDGSGLLAESGSVWRKLNLQRVLDESTKNHLKMRSEEAERQLKSQKPCKPVI